MALRAFCKACLPDDAAPALGGAPLFGPDAEPRPGIACLRSVSASAAGSRQGTGINVGPRTTVDGLRRRACLLMGLDARRRSAATPDRAGGLRSSLQQPVASSRRGRRAHARPWARAGGHGDPWDGQSPGKGEAGLARAGWCGRVAPAPA